MGHSVEYYDGGARARVRVDVDGASLDSDANAIGSQWQTLKNVLTDLPGVLRKRGSIKDATGNSTDINDTSGKLAFYDGPLLGDCTYRPYVGTCLDGANVEAHIQSETSSRRVTFSQSYGPSLLSKAPTVAGFMVLCGRDAANSTYPNRPSYALVYAGASGSAGTYQDGTVTTTTGSSTITGSGTTWTSAMEGSLFFVTGDTYLLSYYRVRKVVSSTSLILDRPWAGSVTGAGKAYTITPTQQLASSLASPFGTAASPIAAKVAAGAWGRLVLAATREAGSTVALSDASPEYRNRIRWSGAINSDDGSGGALGMWAWHADGYLDLADKFGDVVSVVPMPDAVLAFQESGLTVLRGTPVYDGTGSLDASEVHPSVAINGGFAYESTPQGVFFFDKNVGPCVYDGSRIQRLGNARVTRTMLPYGITAVGYYDGKVLFSGTTTAGIFVFDTATAQWSLQVPPAIVSSIIAGRVENDEDVVGLGGGTQVVNLANMFDNPGVAATDWDGSAFTVDLKTGKLGDTLTHLRPERMFITYRLTDLSTTNPYLAATVTTGLPDTSDSAHTWSTSSTDLIETTDVETKELVINLDRDPMTQIRVLQTNAAGKLEIYAIELDCAVEGQGASS